MLIKYSSQEQRDTIASLSAGNTTTFPRNTLLLEEPKSTLFTFSKNIKKLTFVKKDIQEQAQWTDLQEEVALLKHHTVYLCFVSVNKQKLFREQIYRGIK